jgi:hypothetical protein
MRHDLSRLTRHVYSLLFSGGRQCFLGSQPRPCNGALQTRDQAASAPAPGRHPVSAVHCFALHPGSLLRPMIAERKPVGRRLRRAGRHDLDPDTPAIGPVETASESCALTAPLAGLRRNIVFPLLEVSFPWVGRETRDGTDARGHEVVQGQARTWVWQQPRAAVEEMLTAHRQPEAARGAFMEKVVPAAAVIIGLLLLAGPFLSTILRSVMVAPETGASVFALGNFVDLIKDRAFLDAARNTLISGAGATLLSGILGFSLAWIVTRTDIPGRSWFEVLNLVPFFCRPMSAP